MHTFEMFIAECPALIESPSVSVSFPSVVEAAGERLKSIPVRLYSSQKCRWVRPGGHGCPSVDNFTECVIASRQVGQSPVTL